jgi:hypothetical protein
MEAKDAPTLCFESMSPIPEVSFHFEYHNLQFEVDCTHHEDGGIKFLLNVLNIHGATHIRIPDDLSLHQHCCENLRDLVSGDWRRGVG